MWKKQSVLQLANKVLPFKKVRFAHPEKQQEKPVFSERKPVSLNDSN
jgi:hypothetical protein